MKNYIIGSGGFSKEVYSILKRNNLHINGFIDLHKKQFKIDENRYTTIIEEHFLLMSSADINVYIGVGNPKILSNIKEKYHKFNFPNLIDPDSKLLGNISMGIGNIICCNSVFTTDITIGSFNIFNLSCTIGHDVKIKNCNVFNPTCCISGEVQIENNNLFGVNSTVLEKIKISSNNIIGASALVSKNIEESGIYIGIPAKRKI